MAIASTDAEVFYPESDGKPMAETPQHRLVMTRMIECLEDWFAADPSVYISGNMFLYYVQGQARHSVSPDVMVVRGVAKDDGRRIYQTWKEGGKAPDLVIEVTSSSTRREDKQKKYLLYRDKLKVREYILFDPYGEWLRPPLQGHRLVEGEYVPIAMIEGRLPSEVLGLHFEGDGENLRLFDTATGLWLPTPRQRAMIAEQEKRREKAAREAAEEEKQAAEAARQAAEAELQHRDELIRQAGTENERLQRKIAELEAEMKRRGGDASQ